MVFGEWARFEKRLAEGLACDARATVEPFCFDVLLLLIEQCGERGQVGSDVGVIRSERLFGHRDRFEENRFRIPTPSALLEQIAEVHERARQPPRHAPRSRRSATQFDDCSATAAFVHRCGEALAAGETIDHGRNRSDVARGTAVWQTIFLRR